ncbi:MAG: glycosyltransferase family 2 protein [Mucilaginibacter sp.]
MEKPLVSIALCTYNGADYLSQQLDTLVNQMYSPIEIVVVDDCSNDNTFAILTTYAAKYPQFKLYRNEQNLGFVKNFERAVKLCTGELIALCDQDDIWHVEKIALQVEAIKDNVFVYHDSEFIHEDGTSMNRKMSDLMNFYRGDDPLAFLFFNCVSGHAILMKRKLIDEALPLKEGYFHDWWLAYVATNIGTIDFIPQCLVSYRQHDKSDTNILGLSREADNYKFASTYKLERQYKWLGYCVSYPGNKQPQLIKQFYVAYGKRLKSYISMELAGLVYKYRKSVLYIRKKGKLSKLNYVFQQIFGIQAKKIVNNNSK